MSPADINSFIAKGLNFEYEKASKDSTYIRQSAADNVIEIQPFSYYLARSMERVISALAAAASCQPFTFTHLPASRSL